ncbi:MAG TPA: hypothetical protein VGF39_07885 [Stellaceae bacterium]
MAEALQARRFPTITIWNRLEGRPRTADFQRALRTETRDALWMIGRQWQVGEFKGEDAGSPVFARVHAATARLTRFQAGDAAAADFDDATPLEGRVAQLPLQTVLGGQPAALDLRLMTGRRWLKLIAGIGSYASLFIGRYKIRQPDATLAADAAICAHPEVWQSFAAAAGRAMDGWLLYQYLIGAAGRHAYDWLTVPDAHKEAFDDAADLFVPWVAGLVLQPQAGGKAWRPDRLEYKFGCAAPVADGAKNYVAEEYSGGPLDWHSVDVASAGKDLGENETLADPRAPITRTMIPVPVRYAGMPHPRWWTIEDGRTNFGDIRPDTTDLAKLLFIEFGLVYSNDWFLIPFTLPAGSIVDLQGLVVRNVFGEQFWIEAAGSGADANWQRWSLFTVSAHAQPAAAADTSLLVLPTAPKVSEGAPLEHIALMRDEMANMVWAIEKTIPGGDGRGRAGAAAGRETRAYFERLVAAAGGAAPPALLDNDAAIRYNVMTSVPEHWIPFVPVRANGSQQATVLQRGAMTRIIEGDPNPPHPVQPRTSLMRHGLDQSGYQPYFVAEEEVPRAGTQVRLSYKRARWLDGKVVIWLGARKEAGRGEGSSGLAFDQIASS